MGLEAGAVPDPGRDEPAGAVHRTVHAGSRTTPTSCWPAASPCGARTDVKGGEHADEGPSWTRIKPPSNGLISAAAVAAGDSDRVWVGYDSGEIDQSLNATATTPTWTRVDGPAPTRFRASRFCHQIFVSPHDPNTVLVAFGGFTSGNLWRTEDGGLTWADISGSVPRARFAP